MTMEEGEKCPLYKERTSMCIRAPQTETFAKQKTHKNT